MPDKIPGFCDFQTWKKQKTFFGVYNITFGRAFGKFGLRFLSDQALSGKKPATDIIDDLYMHRNAFISQLPNLYYAECNPVFYGLIPYINDIWTNVRIIYVVRNGYDWITSHMNWGHWYNEKRLSSIIVRRLKPSDFADDKLTKKWGHFDRFQKLCWAWEKINRLALESVKSTKNARLYRFEDIFQEHLDCSALEKLVEFGTSHFSPEHVLYELANQMMQTKVNANTGGKFSDKEGWTNSMHQLFYEICGDLMKQLKYPLHPF